MKPMSRNKQGPEDVNEIAFRVLQQATGESTVELKADKNPSAVALGRLGGLAGGKARAAKLSPEERSYIARRAAAARWKRPKDGE